MLLTSRQRSQLFSQLATMERAGILPAQAFATTGRDLPADARQALAQTAVALAKAEAAFAALVDNLIQAVNILGSIFYGVILGIFLVAFFLKWVRATPAFLAALVAQTGVIVLYFVSDIGFLWFNVIGCALVVGAAALLQAVWPGGSPTPAPLEETT